jgi:hypothetical protein
MAIQKESSEFLLPLQMIAGVESLFTELALIRAIAGMNPIVLHQRVGLREGRSTDFALVWLGLRVGRHVGLEIAPWHEVGWAERAAEVLETLVAQKVLAEVRVAVEGLSTLRAEELLKRWEVVRVLCRPPSVPLTHLVIRMRLQMVLQLRNLQVALTTDMTRVRRKTFVSVQMVDQLLAHRERLVAHSAEMRLVLLVGPQMPQEVVELGEASIAVLAVDRVLFCCFFVFSHVIFQARLVAEAIMRADDAVTLRFFLDLRDQIRVDDFVALQENLRGEFSLAGLAGVHATARDVSLHMFNQLQLLREWLVTLPAVELPIDFLLAVSKVLDNLEGFNFLLDLLNNHRQILIRFSL